MKKIVNVKENVDKEESQRLHHPKHWYQKQRWKYSSKQLMDQIYMESLAQSIWEQRKFSCKTLFQDQLLFAFINIVFFSKSNMIEIYCLKGNKYGSTINRLFLLTSLGDLRNKVLN